MKKSKKESTSVSRVSPAESGKVVLPQLGQASSPATSQSQLSEKRLESVPGAKDKKPSLAGSTSKMVNAIDALSPDSGDAEGGEGLRLVRLTGSKGLFVPFCSGVVPVSVHWPDIPEIKGWVRCSGPGCLLCKVGKEVKRQHLLPIYEVASRSIGLLAISDDRRPGALGPQIRELLSACERQGGPMLAIISKTSPYAFTVSSLPLTDAVDIEKSVIERFNRRLQDGQLDIATVHCQLSNAELSSYPVIATAMRALGVTL